MVDPRDVDWYAIDCAMKFSTKERLRECCNITENVEESLLVLHAEVEMLREELLRSGAWGSAPCCVCGYNGPGYFQPRDYYCVAIARKLHREE